uniref:Periplasmic binding protein/LacI transcriptional regulator n=1 Tax=Shewanella sp. (strain ANA-3) TaxID=94122 RepID=UPI000DF720C3|nr:Chain A, Periplasmic binding protein/LacI transcriptional regulator [Shewanella sp. ANA-3]5OCP_B Chain B, Periplasmic binding protein/LacI transcriptional regulator [Shewanella sp. ANA-3]
TTVGFSQVGSESGWRTSFSEAVKAEAKQRGIDLKFADAQQKQENQIKAVRSFIAQGVDAIIIAPVVETGWKPVLKEAKRAKIPVVIVDRNIKVDDDSLFLTRIASDFSEEGRKIGQWLMDKTQGNCDIAELQGTVGATAAIDRAAGFNQVIANYPNAKIVRSQTGEFTRAKGKEVMEGFLKAQNGQPLCAVWSHNDEMALGAVQAIKEAGLKPGKDILIVSVDGVPDYFKAMADGDVNATVELSPYLGGPAFDAIDAYLKGNKDQAKLISTTGDVFTQETAAAEYEKRRQQAAALEHHHHHH